MLWLKPDSSFCNCYIFAARWWKIHRDQISKVWWLKFQPTAASVKTVRVSNEAEMLIWHFPIVFLGSYLISPPDAESGNLPFWVGFGGQVCVEGAYGNGAERCLMSGLLKGAIDQILSLSAQPLCHISPAEPFLLHIMHLPSQVRGSTSGEIKLKRDRRCRKVCLSRVYGKGMIIW